MELSYSEIIDIQTGRMTPIEAVHRLLVDLENESEENTASEAIIERYADKVDSAKKCLECVPDAMTKFLELIADTFEEGGKLELVDLVEFSKGIIFEVDCAMGHLEQAEE
jgi:phage host-nuclease inhibitor protein Gam